jgi:aminoglycoside 3-N-acetyltransferase
MNLFNTDTEKILTDVDLEAALRSLGLHEGEAVFLHSDVSVFGKSATLDRNAFLSSILDVFIRILTSKGLLVMPTFTYSFCEGKIYDRERSKSTTGALTEFFRTSPGVVRTDHPIFSTALWGTRAEKVQKVGTDSFDERSIFGHMHREDGSIVFLGVPFWTTFVHYIEQVHGIPYRFLKTFEGTIVDGSVSRESANTYLVRPLDGSIETSLKKLEKRLQSLGLLHEKPFGKSKLLRVRIDDMFREGMRMLDEDIYSFLEHHPILQSTNHS